MLEGNSDYSLTLFQNNTLIPFLSQPSGQDLSLQPRTDDPSKPEAWTQLVGLLCIKCGSLHHLIPSEVYNISACIGPLSKHLYELKLIGHNIKAIEHVVSALMVMPVSEYQLIFIWNIFIPSESGFLTVTTI